MQIYARPLHRDAKIKAIMCSKRAKVHAHTEKWISNYPANWEQNDRRGSFHFLVMNQTEFRLNQNRKENCHYREINF